MVDNKQYKEDWCTEQEGPLKLQEIYDSALEKSQELARNSHELATEVGLLSEKHKTLNNAYS